MGGNRVHLVDVRVKTESLIKKHLEIFRPDCIVVREVDGVFSFGLYLIGRLGWDPRIYHGQYHTEYHASGTPRPTRIAVCMLYGTGDEPMNGMADAALKRFYLYGPHKMIETNGHVCIASADEIPHFEWQF